MPRWTVVYAFRCPRGRVYVGKHLVRRGHDPRTWPRRGRGSLPDGYLGSGKVWRTVRRVHGRAVEWRLLAVVAGARREDWEPIERRAIRVAGAILPRGVLLNLTEGGDGLTSAVSQALWTDAELRAWRAEQTRRQWEDPAFRARMVQAARSTSERCKTQGLRYQQALPPCVPGRRRVRSPMLLGALELLQRPEGASVECVAALLASLGVATESRVPRAHQLINEVNRYLGYGIEPLGGEPFRWRVYAEPLEVDRPQPVGDILHASPIPHHVSQ